MYMTPAFHMWTNIDGWDLGRPEDLLHHETFLLPQFPPESLGRVSFKIYGSVEKAPIGPPKLTGMGSGHKGAGWCAPCGLKDCPFVTHSLRPCSSYFALTPKPKKNLIHFPEPLFSEEIPA
jgi:hypothetical protein